MYAHLVAGIATSVWHVVTRPKLALRGCAFLQSVLPLSTYMLRQIWLHLDIQLCMWWAIHCWAIHSMGAGVQASSATVRCSRCNHFMCAPSRDSRNTVLGRGLVCNVCKVSNVQ